MSNTDDAGEGSLRQAVQDANENPGYDIIEVNVTGTITLLTGELVVTDGMRLNGPGVRLLTLSGNGSSRIFSFGAPDAAEYILRNITLSSGFSGEAGGALHIDDPDDSLELERVEVRSSSAREGAGLWVRAGKLVVRESLFVGTAQALRGQRSSRAARTMSGYSTQPSRGIFPTVNWQPSSCKRVPARADL